MYTSLVLMCITTTQFNQQNLAGPSEVPPEPCITSLSLLPKGAALLTFVTLFFPFPYSFITCVCTSRCYHLGSPAFELDRSEFLISFFENMFRSFNRMFVQFNYVSE